ncbi:methyl-accepting chemotaxis protein [Rhodoferax saidenbachensis]|uniref:Methyl-accepting transducer domain-containing protein n=1 Tax=Rhodoferax saidenbachensis TaxID=1484693 RepID=A0A1P8KE18_9BURK|nr:methyl-accepting chemotaxis protein [Rhodoferax saidenbachensis]APW44222.1 hypothetical protein RS694_17925 [Rhodoferax saidenbachensis]
MNFNTMRVSSRLGLAFSLVVAVAIISAALAIVKLSDIQNNLQEVVQVNNVKTKLNQDMAEAVHIVSRVMRTVILLDNKADREQEMRKITQARAEYDAAWTALEAFPASEKGKANRLKISEASKVARPLNDKVIQLALTGGNETQARELLMASAGPAVTAWQEALDDNIALQEATSLAQYHDAEANYIQARTVLLSANALSVALAIVLAWWVTRSITHQLGGEPSDAAQLAQSVANGNLATTIHLKAGDRSSMLAQLKVMQESLSKVVSSVRAGSEAVAAASAQIAQGNNDLSGRTEEQASALEETAASMEELSSTVTQNADNARQANQLAQSASTVAIQGGQVVGQVVETMKGINESSRKISDIISVIDGIAFQTNILALNAAVEAARAGEQGRGFAVVAAEVRSLAGRSAEAAKEIKLLINASVERVESGSALVDQAGMTMSEVVGAIQRVTDIMGEISAASTEQSQGVEQIGEAVSQMDQVTQQNAALVEEMAAAASSLKSQAQELVKVVATFELLPASV